MQVGLIRNPDSGSAGEGDVRSMLEAAGASVREFEISTASAAGDEAGLERIVVAGGDGSIALAALAASSAEIPLAVVPAGTANDFAARMGIPAELEDAARLAIEGERTRAVDLAAIGSRSSSSRHFLNVASLGLPPAAADHAESMKERLGALAYTVGALRAGIEADPLDCRVRCDGTTLHEGEVWQVTIGSTGAFGGGSEIEADADDGLLDVVVFEAGSRARLAKHALGLRQGGVEEHEGVHSSRCGRIEIEVASGQDLNVDGEVVADSELRDAEAGPLVFTVEEKAFTLVIG